MEHAKRMVADAMAINQMTQKMTTAGFVGIIGQDIGSTNRQHWYCQ